MRSCATAIPGVERRPAKAHRAAPNLLDIASLPSDVAGRTALAAVRDRAPSLKAAARVRNASSDLFTESRMLVWSAFLAAVLATDSTRAAPDPKVTVTVDSSRKELVVTAGPFDLPNMPPMEDHGMMDHGESHDTPIQRFQWPIEGWLRGFELELKDGQGNPVPRGVIHHMIMVNFSRRMLL
jgi:hypothetical protein